MLLATCLIEFNIFGIFSFFVFSDILSIRRCECMSTTYIDAGEDECRNAMVTAWCIIIPKGITLSAGDFFEACSIRWSISLSMVSTLE